VVRDEIPNAGSSRRRQARSSRWRAFFNGQSSRFKSCSAVLYLQKANAQLLQEPVRYSGHDMRALVVDDDAGFRALMVALLASTAEVVEQAADGEAAVALAGSLRPELVVMDISMPGMSGIDAAAEIVKALPQTRVVFVSGTETEQKLEDAACGGRYAVVRKGAADLSAGLATAMAVTANGLSTAG
jgi:CheY-like chemotaxis protein